MAHSPVLEDMLRCIRDAGWEATASWTGGIDGPSIDPSQAEQYQAASDACAETTGWNRYNDWDSWTEAQIVELYKAEVANHQCLVGLGFDSADPPSKQQFIDTFHSADQYYSFNPGIDTLSDADYPRVFGTCPPPTWFPAGVW